MYALTYLGSKKVHIEIYEFNRLMFQAICECVNFAVFGIPLAFVPKYIGLWAGLLAHWETNNLAHTSRNDRIV